ncbi:hypothetical protein KUTeg_014823 [Tegillarca granosa]|uniref:Uncharacterized protein n=1 Tax=Tegillarca granosa TaxID=220873 RepID=A0ABQ9EVK7_TEGGR|nr:hypothetical protein KUTeg_014823 [Tegillarca granosa]
MPPLRGACIVCQATIGPKQHAFQCKKCQRWQLRTCNTASKIYTVSLDVYSAIILSTLYADVAYNERDDVYRFIRKLFALPLLPAEHGPDAFEQLSSGSHPTQIVELLKYIYDTWTTSSVASWSVFNMSVRTNNNVEGWQNLCTEDEDLVPLSFQRNIDSNYRTRSSKQ